MDGSKEAIQITSALLQTPNSASGGILTATSLCKHEQKDATIQEISLLIMLGFSPMRVCEMVTQNRWGIIIIFHFIHLISLSEELQLWRKASWSAAASAYPFCKTS